MPEHRRFVPAGPNHPRVRQYRNIRDNRAPNRGSAVALEGLWSIRAAREAGAAVEAVFVCPELLRGDQSLVLVEQLGSAGATTLSVSARTLARMVDRDGPDGLAAIGHLRTAELPDLRPGPVARVLVLDGLELAGNVGSLVRCADAVGAAGVILTDRRARLNHPMVLKASMGTVFSLPVAPAHPEDALAWLRAHRFHVLVADPAGRTPYRQARYPDRVAVVLGAERSGLNAFWRAAADESVSIPMLGRADSLNVGHAGALLLYEALRQQALPGQGSTPIRAPRS